MSGSSSLLVERSTQKAFKLEEQLNLALESNWKRRECKIRPSCYWHKEDSGFPQRSLSERGKNRMDNA